MKAVHAVWFAAALILTATAAAISCGDGHSSGGGDDCRQHVSDPMTDCNAVCTAQTCALAEQCQDYVNVGSGANCIKECLAGCAAGCIPVGTTDCIAKFTDCQTLSNCLTSLFRY